MNDFQLLNTELSANGLKSWIWQGVRWFEKFFPRPMSFFVIKVFYWFCCLFLLLRSSVSYGRPYCYSIECFSSILIVGLPFPTEDLNVILLSVFLLYYYYCSPWFSTRFSQPFLIRFSWNFSGHMRYSKETLLAQTCAKIYFRSRVISHLVIFSGL